MGFSEDTAYLGPFYRMLESVGKGAAMGENTLAGVWHAQAAFGARYLGSVPGVGAYYRQLEKDTAATQRDAIDRAKAMTPDATTTGSAVQLVNGVGSGLYRYTVGSLVGGPLAGAATVGTTEATSRYQELLERGATPGTAGASAAVTGGFAAAGALLPAGFGSSLIAKIATGAASNLGFGLVSRYADHKVLEAAGYPEMAEQQKVWDSAALMTDLILGGGFGAFAHYMHARGVKPEEALIPAGAWGASPRTAEFEAQLGRDAPGVEDAALTANLAMRDRASSPGVPTDPGAAQSSQTALETAIGHVMQGKRVDVSGTGIENATFAARPAEDRSNVQTLFVNALKDAGVLDEQRNLERLEQALGAKLRGETPAPIAPREATAAPAAAWEIPRAEEGKLSAGDRDIETRFTQAMQSDYEGMKARYAQLPDAAGGKVLNTDTARELSPDYLADRTRSAAVHEPASAFIKRLYADKLAEAPGPGEEPMVLFTAGGTGAGKSTAIKNALGDAAERAQIVFDTNMNGAKSAISKIDQALAAGKQVNVAYVHREPVDALVNGALKRAMRQEAENGVGRGCTVPIEEHANTHVGANETIREIVDHYAGKPGVTLDIIDNTRGPKSARLINLEDLPRLDYNRTREETSAALEEAHAQARISPTVYRGFRGERPAGPGAAAAAPAGEPGVTGSTDAGAAAERVGSVAGGQPEPQRSGERPDQLGPYADFEKPVNADPATRTDADRALSTKAIGMYSTSGHFSINSELRWPSGRKATPGHAAWEQPAAHAIDAAFHDPAQPERALFDEDTQVHRGFGLRSAKNLEALGTKGNFLDLAKALEAGNLKPGTVLRDPAFLSTTRDRGEANLFASDKPYATPVNLEITVPKGTPYLKAGAHYLEGAEKKLEQEALLERGSGVKVSKVEEGVDAQGKKSYTIHGDLVPPGAEPGAEVTTFAASKVDPLADPAHQAVQENPQLQIPDEQGRLVSADKALGQADQAVADAERDAQTGINAAINCFMRKGAA